MQDFKIQYMTFVGTVRVKNRESIEIIRKRFVGAAACGIFIISGPMLAETDIRATLDFLKLENRIFRQIQVLHASVWCKRVEEAQRLKVWSDFQDTELPKMPYSGMKSEI